jgi:segregation and condensation protein B
MKASVGAILTAADKPVTLAAMAKGMCVTEVEVEDALQEFEADLMAADQGVQVRHRAGAVRLEVKPQYIDMVGRVLQQWTPKELTAAASLTLALIAFQQPVTIGELNAQRGKDCTATIQTLRNRKLVARTAELGPRRQKRWRTTPHFLEVFGLSSIEEFYKEGTKERLLPGLFSGDPEEESGEDVAADLEVSDIDADIEGGESEESS